MKREKFGIKGFDDLVQGGIPKNSIVALSGPPGVGKSIFTLHYLLEGAKKGQKCLYINLEEPRSNIDSMLNTFKFGQEFIDLEKQGKIVVKCLTYPEYEKVFTDLFQKINEEKNIQRVAIDSFNIFFLSAIYSDSITLTSQINIRRMINKAFHSLRRENLTTLLVLEKDSHDSTFQYNVPYLVDGMINLDFLDFGTIERRIFIQKMRWTSQYKDSKAFEINNNGIAILE